ncbi:unnamed protein product [Nesidiocoris tenuis]|uniref:Uncharacterized protein n=1 Tax=Nesidiocoris tenuis TaxID=355587 RepID=A0A6H5GHN9_9HEMI|nr:unnamed protein product [Nesidiocoris tenuis]
MTRKSSDTNDIYPKDFMRNVWSRKFTRADPKTIKDERDTLSLEFLKIAPSNSARMLTLESKG